MQVSRRRLAMLVGASLALALAFAAGSLAPASTADAAHGAPANRLALHDQMRQLWAGDHIVWTRCYIVSAATLPANLPYTDPTAARLLDNQTAIGDAFKPYYGADAGNHLTELLRTHILQAAAIIADAKAGNTAQFNADNAAWYANAEEIAAFLHSLNPRNWPQETVESLLEAHLDLTLEEASQRLQGHYSADIAAYDRVHAEILQLADALSAGIIAQFPQKFAR
jgi:hypothetical protein